MNHKYLYYPGYREDTGIRLPIVLEACPDDYEDLGLIIRRMVAQILKRQLGPSKR